MFYLLIIVLYVRFKWRGGNNSPYFRLLNNFHFLFILSKTFVSGIEEEVIEAGHTN